MKPRPGTGRLSTSFSPHGWRGTEYGIGSLFNPRAPAGDIRGEGRSGIREATSPGLLKTTKSSAGDDPLPNPNFNASGGPASVTFLLDGDGSLPSPGYSLLWENLWERKPEKRYLPGVLQGLKIHWGQLRAGSNPAPGTSETCNAAVRAHLRYFVTSLVTTIERGGCECC